MFFPSGFDTAANIVVILHSDNTQTSYVASLDTDVSRGTVLKSAVAASVSGDSVFLPAKTFDIGKDNHLVLPANVCFIGSGKLSTIIKSDADNFEASDAVVALSNNDLVANMTVWATSTSNNQGTIGSFLNSRSFKNVVLINLKFR